MNRRSFLGSALVEGGAAAASAMPRMSGRLAAYTPTASERGCLRSSPPARTLWALRITELDTKSYWGGEMNRPDGLLPLTCLQGLVNRVQPQIFLVYDRFDELWLNWLRERGDADEIRFVGTEQFYDRFLPSVNGLVVTDFRLPATVNVATMLAGIKGWLPISPRLLDLFDLPVVMDLRNRWQKNIDAYRWFYTTYGSQMTNRACAYLDPGVFELRDYFVEFRVPLIWVSGAKDVARNPAASPTEEREFARDLFLKLPPNIPCMGWPGDGMAGEAGIGEMDGVRLASQCAKFELCSGWDGSAHPTSNLSVHSGTSAKFRQETYPPPELENKVYVTFTRTDGDGPNFWRHVFRKMWSDPEHGKIPVGWQLGPSVHDLMPDVMDYYYRHATPKDMFVNALTGVGYIHEEQYADFLPEEQQKAVWDEYVELSKRYFKRFGFSCLTTWREMRLGRLERFAELPGLKGLFLNYVREDSTTIDNLVAEVRGIPAFRAVVGHGAPVETRVGIERAVARAVGDIRRFTVRQRPAFVHASLSNWAVAMKVLVEIEKTLGPEYRVVRPDQMAALYRKSKGRS